MTRIGYIADVHVGNHRVMGGPVDRGINRRCRLVLNALARATKTALQLGCEELVVLGDLFDTAKPSPQMIFEAWFALGHAMSKPPKRLLCGNHDQSTSATYDNALSALSIGEGFSVYDTTAENLLLNDMGLVLVPFANEDASRYIPEQARECEGRLDRSLLHLGIHAGIRDERTPTYLQNAKDSIHKDALFDLMDELDVDLCVAGNWHSHQSWTRGERSIVQCGALAPTGFDNTGMKGYGSLIVADGARWTRHEIPGPRFLVDRFEDMDESDYMKLDGVTQVFLRILAHPAHMAEANAMRDRLVEAEVVEDAQVLPDQEVARVQSLSAARAARKGETLDEALSGFVERMPLDDAVSREGVLERARGYLVR